MEYEYKDKLNSVLYWLMSKAGDSWGGNYPYGSPGKEKCLECASFTRTIHYKEDCKVKYATELLGVEFELITDPILNEPAWKIKSQKHDS